MSQPLVFVFDDGVMVVSLHEYNRLTTEAGGFVEFTLTTPALLFPAISLLLLAYTNRFLTLAALMRDLHGRYRANPDARIKGQLRNLAYRIVVIRNMQACGVASFFFCVLSMFALFAEHRLVGQWLFGAALVLLLVSLALSLREIQVSIDALMLQTSDVLDEPDV